LLGRSLKGFGFLFFELVFDFNELFGFDDAGLFGLPFDATLPPHTETCCQDHES
jgi:hypothetical protein